MRRATICILAGFLHLGASVGLMAWGAEPSTSDPAAWKDEVAAFEKQDADAPPAPGSVVFVGSSSIRLWDTGKWFPDEKVINRGFGGSQVCDSTRLAEALVVKYEPRVIVFYAGDNDVNSGKSAEQVHVNFRAFVAKVRASLPDAPIVFISIKPSIARWKLRDVQREANRLIAADCAEDETLEFVDVWPVMLGADGLPRKELFVEDGLHMNEAGYKLWTEFVQPHLEVTAN